MAGFRTNGEVAAAIESGQFEPFSVRKAPSASFITVSGRWCDLSMAGGNPPANFYIGNQLAATALDPFRGIFHGSDKSPAVKRLAEMTLQTPTAGLVGAYKLLNYRGFIPFVDLEDADEQVVDNTVELLPDGEVAQVILVVTNQTTAGGSFTFDYVDADGNSQTSPVIFTDTTSISSGSIATSAPATVAGQGPFLTLLGGDIGVNRITAFRNLTPTGGLAALVLVQPLAELAIREINSPSEFVWLGPGATPPLIEDGAFLGLIANCAASIASGLLVADGFTVWN